MPASTTEEVPIVTVDSSEVELFENANFTAFRAAVNVQIPPNSDLIYEYVSDAENVRIAFASPSPIDSEGQVEMDKWLSLVGCNVGRITKDGQNKSLIRARVHNSYSQPQSWCITVIFQSVSA